ncbi:MAG: ATP-binding protein [Paracoccaceae bacterium]|uniref:ATP-binding protein n=1 Tax=Seohaeicola saemankumensis TaxID=481181 RepID=UPI0022A98497|nr:ATP-binding protein [Seohaeicola saemankumensis]
MSAERLPRNGAVLSDQGHEIRLRCRTNPPDIRATLLVWRYRLAQIEPCEDLLGRSEIVLAEILNNIAEHGRGDGQKQGEGDWIELCCHGSPEGIHMLVKDRGRALPQHLLSGEKYVATPLAGVALDDLPEGGFGWFMIRALSCDLHCQWTATGNLLSLTVPRNHSTGAADGQTSQKSPNPT